MQEPQVQDPPSPTVEVEPMEHTGEPSVVPNPIARKPEGIRLDLTTQNGFLVIKFSEKTEGLIMRRSEAIALINQIKAHLEEIEKAKRPHRHAKKVKA